MSVYTYAMLTLYVKTGCPFCAMVIDTMRKFNLPYEEKNIADQAVAEELAKLGGKRQTPFLVDGDNGISMYESSDIIRYLSENFGRGKGPAAEPPKGGVCPVG